MFEVILSILGVFGVCSLVANYDGPADILVRLRSKVPVLRCTICLATWVIIGMGVAGMPFSECCATLGGVILLERLT